MQRLPTHQRAACLKGKSSNDFYDGFSQASPNKRSAVGNVHEWGEPIYDHPFMIEKIILGVVICLF